MMIKTSCGHVLGSSWVMDDFVFRFVFTCPKCGSEQIVPPQNLFSEVQVESAEANEWLVENGYRPLPEPAKKKAALEEGSG